MTLEVHQADNVSRLDKKEMLPTASMSPDKGQDFWALLDSTASSPGRDARAILMTWPNWSETVELSSHVCERKLHATFLSC